MFRKLGRRFRALLSRDYHLDEELQSALEQGIPLQFEAEHFFAQLEPATAALEEAKAAAMANDWKEAGQSLLDHFQDRLRPHGFLQLGEVEGVVAALRNHPQDCRRWLKGAESAAQHRFSPLQGDEVHFAHSIDWYCDFRGGSWMMANPEMLRNHFATQPLDLDQQEALQRTWSFAQLGHLLTLGRGYWLTGNEAFASECIVQSVDWQERNPIFMGMSWIHPKVVATRSLYWYLFIQHILGSHLMQGEIFTRLLKTLLLHAGFLALHLRQNGNYRLVCAASLYLLTAHLGEFSPCKRWASLARQHLHIALQEEFHSDGLHRSGNLSLHREALDWMLLCALFDHFNSRAQDGLLPSCESALEALVYLKPPVGNQGELGPTVNEGLLGYQVGPAEHAQRLLALGGYLLQRADFNVSGEVPAELVWWLGPEVGERIRSLGKQEPKGIRRLFGPAQIAVIRDQWGPRATWCQFRGYSGRSRRDGEGRFFDPHPVELPCHDDALSLALNLDGEPLLIEPGIPLVGGELGRCFARMGAHNSVRIGRELEPQQVAPDLEENPRLTLESCKEGHYLCCQRPVWFDMEEPFWLTREILFMPKKQRIVVRDHLDGEGEVHVETNLLLAPHLDILMRGDMGSLLRGRKLQARILPLFPTRFRYEVLKGKSQGLQGFYWSESGRAVPTHLLRYFARVQAPATISLWIAWNPDDTLTPRHQDVDRLFKSR